MRSTKNNGDAAKMRLFDALSRLAVWVANHADSPQISKLGLTHIPGGAVDASGMTVLHCTGPGLTLEKHSAEVPGIVPLERGSAMTTSVAPPGLQTTLFDVAPGNVLPVLYEMTAGVDPVYIAGKLGLLKRDMDKVTGPKLFREFREPQVPVIGLFNMECRDADGNFTGRYILHDGSVYAAKLFKYADVPDSTYFFFAPNESVIYAPRECSGVFTANANIACGNPGMGWIGKSGGVEELDWGIIKRYGEEARLVWAAFPDDPYRTKNNFSEALAIATEARRHGVNLKMIEAKAVGEEHSGWWEAHERQLNDREIRKLARRYKLKVDPVWNGLPGEIDFGEEFPARRVPPFWNGNRSAEFFGEKSDDFLLEIVTPRLMSWVDCGRVLVVIDEKDKLLARRIHGASEGTVRVVTFEVFKDQGAFIEKVPSVAEMVFVVPPLDEKKFSVQEVYEACAQAGLLVGLFSRSQDAPPEQACTTQYCVKELSASSGSVFCVKDMKSNTVTKYKFFWGGVEEAPGTENEMAKGE